MTALHIDHMAEDELLVRGTLDVQQALCFLVGTLDDLDGDDWRLIGVTPATEGKKPDWYTGAALLVVDPVQRIADWLHARIARARPGYYRKVNCLPGSRGEDEGWSWQIGFANGPGRGAFKAVYFQWV